MNSRWRRSCEPSAVFTTVERDVNAAPAEGQAIEPSRGIDPAGPESRLLLHCIRRVCGTNADPGALITRDLDWARLLRFAKLHGLTPLLRVGLDGLEVPGPAAACIVAEYQCSAAVSLAYARELVRTNEAFCKEGIPVLAFKGPALAVRAFGKLSIREYRDLDLLVAPCDLARSVSVLWKSGYRLAPTSVGRAGHRNQKHVCLIREGAGTYVELHWAVSNPSFSFEIPFSGLWERRERISVLGALVAAPQVEDSLLMLSAHGASHCWASLKWVCDIAALVNRCPEVDWPSLLKRARDRGGLRMVLLALALARDVAGAELPPAVRKEVDNDPAACRLCDESRTRIFAVAGPLDDGHRALTSIQSRERLRDRIRVAIAYVRPRLHPTQRDRALIALPPSLRFLYWPLRFARLLASYPLEIGKPMLAGLAGRR